MTYTAEATHSSDCRSTSRIPSGGLFLDQRDIQTRAVALPCSVAFILCEPSSLASPKRPFPSPLETYSVWLVTTVTTSCNTSAKSQTHGWTSLCTWYLRMHSKQHDQCTVRTPLAHVEIEQNTTATSILSEIFSPWYKVRQRIRHEPSLEARERLPALTCVNHNEPRRFAVLLES